jgi:hypothetical protein
MWERISKKKEESDFLPGGRGRASLPRGALRGGEGSLASISGRRRSIATLFQNDSSGDIIGGVMDQIR